MQSGASWMWPLEKSSNNNSIVTLFRKTQNWCLTEYFLWLTCSLKACRDLNSVRSIFFLTQSGSSGISTLKSTLTRISRCCTERASPLGQADVKWTSQSSILTSTKTANSTMFVLFTPPPFNNSCNRGDSSRSQQLDTTETKLRISKAI